MLDLQFAGENTAHHTGTLRGNTKVLLEAEKGSRALVSIGSNGKDRGGSLRIGHLSLKAAPMKFMFTVIVRVYCLGLPKVSTCFWGETGFIWEQLIAIL